MTTETKMPEGAVILSDTFKQVTGFKKLVEGIAKDTTQSEEMRRYARGLLHPLNALIAQAMTELAG